MAELAEGRREAEISISISKQILWPDVALKSFQSSSRPTECNLKDDLTIKFDMFDFLQP